MVLWVLFLRDQTVGSARLALRLDESGTSKTGVDTVTGTGMSGNTA